MLVPGEPLDFPSNRSMEEPDYASLEEEPDSQAMDNLPEEPEELMNITSRRIPSNAEYCNKNKEHTMCKYKVILIIFVLLTN